MFGSTKPEAARRPGNPSFHVDNTDYDGVY